MYADVAARPSVGIIGWRGMVGSVLMQRMLEENDFAKINPVFFSTSNQADRFPNSKALTPPRRCAMPATLTPWQNCPLF